MALEERRMNLQSSLPTVSFDFAGLVAWAQGMTSKYDGLVVTEEQVPEIKECMAEINKAKISLDNARKETVKKLSAPLKDFEAQIKKVTTIFDDTYKALGDQVQNFVEQEREKKREVVQGIITEELDAYNGEVQPFPIPVQDKWLNKSTSLKSIREAVQEIIAQRIESDRLRRQAEQARVERASAIEQAVKAANAERGIELSVAQFMTPRNSDLGTSLDTICAEIKTAADREVTRLDAIKNAMRTARPATAVSHAIQQPAGQMAAQAAPLPSVAVGPDKTMSIIITYSTAKEQEVRAALATLKGLCTSLSARLR